MNIQTQNNYNPQFKSAKVSFFIKEKHFKSAQAAAEKLKDFSKGKILKIFPKFEEAHASKDEAILTNIAMNIDGDGLCPYNPILVRTDEIIVGVRNKAKNFKEKLDVILGRAKYAEVPSRSANEEDIFNAGMEAIKILG